MPRVEEARRAFERLAVAARPEDGLHPQGLPGAEQELAVVVHVVHLVHEHGAVGAVTTGHAWKRGVELVEQVLVRRVAHVVGARAAGAVVAPNMLQIQPVAYFVHGKPAQGVAGIQSRVAPAKKSIVHYNAILTGIGGHTWENAIAATQRQVADPDVQVVGRVPGSGAAAARLLHRIGAERRCVGSTGVVAPGDAGGRVAAGVAGGQAEAHARIAHARGKRSGHRRPVGAGAQLAAEGQVQRLDLVPDDDIAQVLVLGAVDYVHHHGMTSRGGGGPIGSGIF